MTMETTFVVEVRQVHLHALGRDLDVLPDVWSDALHEFLPDGDSRSVHGDVASARAAARRLREVADIPPEDIRITQVARADISIEADEEPESAGLRMYRWRSEALMNYGYGHAFAMGCSPDEARIAAMAAYKAYLASDAWWGEAPDEDGSFRFEEDREDYETAIERFEADLRADPAWVGEAFVVRGSE